jgi:acyl-CoA reductase-like NAD-dependent aldehyde dehydrogenase
VPIHFIEVPRSKRTPSVLDAINQALTILARLPDTEEARDLREQCRAIEETAKEWARTPPTAEDREAMMKKVLAIHVLLTKVRRSSAPVPGKRSAE